MISETVLAYSIEINLVRAWFTTWACTSNRSSHQSCSVKKSVLRNFTKFTGKHLCQSLFFNKFAGLRPATLLKKRLLLSLAGLICFVSSFVYIYLVFLLWYGRFSTEAATKQPLILWLSYKVIVNIFEKIHTNEFICIEVRYSSQSIFTCSKSTIETLEQCVKHAQS